MMVRALLFRDEPARAHGGAECGGAPGTPLGAEKHGANVDEVEHRAAQPRHATGVTGARDAFGVRVRVFVSHAHERACVFVCACVCFQCAWGGQR